jgi:hypothetical protein
LLLGKTDCARIGNQLRQPPPIRDRGSIRAGDMELGREVDRELLGPLALDDRAVLVEEDGLEFGELGVG